MSLRATASALFAAPGSRWWAPPTAVGLVIATCVRDGLGADAVAFSGVQLVLVALAAVDFATRRLPNVLTLPTAALALVLRAGLERGHLADAASAGVAAAAVFAVLHVVLRGGLGMGDVKLAGMLGFVLGSAVVPALTVGILAGGLASAGLLAARRASLRSAIAYGPYLALGGAIAILAFHPPALA